MSSGDLSARVVQEAAGEQTPDDPQEPFIVIRISLLERAAQISRKRASGVVLPSVEALANSGRWRTAGKRLLLRTLAEAASRSGRTAPFKANY